MEIKYRKPTVNETVSKPKRDSRAMPNRIMMAKYEARKELVLKKYGK